MIDLAVSPDGTRLAFLTRTPVGGPNSEAEWAVMTVYAAGGEPKEVYRRAQRDGARRSVVWSPDGRRLYFIVGMNTGYLPQREIYSITAEGGPPQSIAVGLHDLYYLNINPNGRQLVFADEQWRNGLYVIENAFAAAKAAKRPL